MRNTFILRVEGQSYRVTCRNGTTIVDAFSGRGKIRTGDGHIIVITGLSSDDLRNGVLDASLHPGKITIKRTRPKRTPNSGRDIPPP